MSSLGNSANVRLEKTGHLGSEVALERTDMTKRQQEIFNVFEKAVKEDLAKTMDDKKRQEILDVIKEVPINVSNPSEHADKTTIVTMMIAFQVLENAHGKPEEFKEAIAAVKAGFYYFTPSDKGPVEATLYAKKAPSPTDEKKTYNVKLTKDNITKLYKGLEALEAPIVTLEKTFDFGQFREIVVSLVANPVKSLDENNKKKAKEELHAKIAYLKTVNLGDNVNKVLDDLEREPKIENLEKLAKALGSEIDDVKRTDAEKAEYLLKLIEQKITEKIK